MTEKITDHEFVGLRQWGLIAAPDEPCQFVLEQGTHGARRCPRDGKLICGYPKNDHES